MENKTIDEMMAMVKGIKIEEDVEKETEGLYTSLEVNEPTSEIKDTASNKRNFFRKEKKALEEPIQKEVKNETPMMEEVVQYKVANKDEVKHYYLINKETGERHMLLKDKITVGTRNTSDIIPERQLRVHHVSKDHAILFLRGEMLFLKDISTNGTFLVLNGKEYRLPKDCEVELKKDEIIKFADKEFTLRRI